MYLKLVVTLISAQCLYGWTDDGQALTPPMGFVSYTAFDNDENCDKYPNECVNEKLYKDMADRLVADGFKDLGYEYINIDDRWSEVERDSQTRRLVPNKKRFPNGIKALTDYMHSKGLKFGIYGDIGNLTCSGVYPGLNNHTPGGKDYFDVDAQTFSEWGVDSFKVDGCYEDTKKYDTLYPKLAQAMNATGHKMLLVCEWPFFQYVFSGINPDYDAIAKTCHAFRNYKDSMDSGINPDYDAIAKTCHAFRNYKDSMDSWASIDEIIQYYGQYNDLFIKHSGPGHWADPDELSIGNSGLSWHQSRTQMAMWCMWSSPLLMSTDNSVNFGLKSDSLTNRIPKIKKDSLSKPTLAISDTTCRSPEYSSMSHKVSELIKVSAKETKYEVHDLFVDEGKEVLGTLGINDMLELLVHTSGAVRVVKLLVK
ncbi:unnamed protein product [Oppiella nova]|uniref:Alpha-galactosidase n=1 Tax=Oppiella nova TaxID=334625 RepID=A0A7R9LDG1_9ACAR|nr:unnamed protein product [Oppiella nova]CAG2162528.1 unnamed protein product [Oppiella nova]